MFKQKGFWLIIISITCLVLANTTLVSLAAPKYNEAPELAALVKAGKLPSVDKRLPAEPAVVKPLESIGTYGGEWKMGTMGAGDEPIWDRSVGYDPLIRADRELKDLVPNLAKSWKVSPDASTFTFTLRKGVKWSDGQPFTSEDIVFWYNDIISNPEVYPNIPTWLTTNKEPVKVTALDDYTVEFKFSKPNSIFLTAMTTTQVKSMLMPKHYLKQFVPKYAGKEAVEQKVKEANAKSWGQLYLKKADPWRNTELPTLNPWIVEKPIGAGSQVVFKRNPYYWKVDTKGNQLPYIDRVVGQVVERVEVLNMMSISGEFNFQFRNISASNRPVLEQNKQKAGYRILNWQQTATNAICIYFNLNHKDQALRKIFEDKRFRYAMSYAIDRQAIINAVYDGMAEPRQPAAYKGTTYYDAKYEKAAIKFDTKKANALLDEMGLTKRDKNGYRLRPDGEPLFFTIIVATKATDRVDAAELIRKYWQSVGVNCGVNPLDTNLFYLRGNSVDHDVVLDVGNAGGLEMPLRPTTLVPYVNQDTYQAPLYAEYYASSGERGEAPSGDIKRVQDLYTKFIITPDPAGQKKIMAEIININTENLWVLGISTTPPRPAVASNNFRNVDSWLHGSSVPSPGNLAPEQFYIKK